MTHDSDEIGHIFGIGNQRFYCETLVVFLSVQSPSEGDDAEVSEGSRCRAS